MTCGNFTMLSMESAQSCDEITYPFLNFNGCSIEVKEWIGNFIQHFIIDIIIYPYWG